MKVVFGGTYMLLTNNQCPLLYSNAYRVTAKSKIITFKKSMKPLDIFDAGNGVNICGNKIKWNKTVQNQIFEVETLSIVGICAET